MSAFSKVEKIFLPVTAPQFEKLTNRLLMRFNAIAEPMCIDADYAAKALIGVIHSLEKGVGKVTEDQLLHAMVHRISCHLTFDLSKELEAREKKSAQLSEAADDAEKGSSSTAATAGGPPEEVVPVTGT